jgi:hypothetical protein
MMACEGPEWFAAWFDTLPEAIARYNLAASRAQWESRQGSTPSFDSE